MREPPPGPATIRLDHEGFEVLPPGRDFVLRDLLQVAVGVLLLLLTVGSVIALLGGQWNGFGCLVLAAPGFAFALAHAAGRRLLLVLRGARSVRVLPTELVVTRPGGVDRLPLAEVRSAWASGDQGVQIELVGRPELVEIAAGPDQLAWLAAAIEAAAARARRIPEQAPMPETLRRTRDLARERDAPT